MAFLESPIFISRQEYRARRSEALSYSQLEVSSFATICLLIGARAERASKFAVELTDKYLRSGRQIVEVAFLGVDGEVTHKARCDFEDKHITEVHRTAVRSVKTNELFEIQEGYMREKGDQAAQLEFEQMLAEHLPLLSGSNAVHA